VPTANERKALWFLALVALSGSGVRLWRAFTPPSAAVGDSSGLERQLARVDSVRSTRREKRKPAPARPKVTPPESVAAIDLDRAAPDEIQLLPGIGPALAKRIAANRDSAGAFGAIEALCDVRGVGRALAEKLRPMVTFTGARRPLSDGCGDASKGAGNSRVPRVRKLR
jgi:competence protein ComEA